MDEIYLDGAELKICHNCVNELWMEGNPEKLKKVQHITLYNTEKVEEDEEEI